MKIPFLVGEKCYLRGLSVDDLGTEYFQWLNDQNTTKYMHNGMFPNSDKKMKAFFDRVTDSNTDLVLAIISKIDDVHIGNLGLHNINWIYRKAELGILVGNNSYAGKGLASEAMRLLLGHSFNRLGLNKVFVRTEEENTAAYKAFEKVGFKEEGRLRQECMRDGKFFDTVYMGALKAEFNSK